MHNRFYDFEIEKIRENFPFNGENKGNSNKYVQIKVDIEFF